MFMDLDDNGGDVVVASTKRGSSERSKGDSQREPGSRCQAIDSKKRDDANRLSTHEPVIEVG